VLEVCANVFEVCADVFDVGANVLEVCANVLDVCDNVCDVSGSCAVSRLPSKEVISASSDGAGDGSGRSPVARFDGPDSSLSSLGLLVAARSMNLFCYAAFSFMSLLICSLFEVLVRLSSSRCVCKSSLFSFSITSFASRSSDSFSSLVRERKPLTRR
jgi:hypothetical protein